MTEGTYGTSPVVVSGNSQRTKPPPGVTPANLSPWAAISATEEVQTYLVSTFKLILSLKQWSALQRLGHLSAATLAGPRVPLPSHSYYEPEVVTQQTASTVVTHGSVSVRPCHELFEKKMALRLIIGGGRGCSAIRWARRMRRSLPGTLI
jgi:hypothetical protein